MWSRTLPLRKVGWFLLRFGLFYALLLAPWHVVPTLIWILVTLRPSDLEPILAADAGRG